MAASDPAFETLHGDPRFKRITGAPSRGLTRAEGWRHDLAYFVEEAKRMHAGPDRPAHSAAFDSTASALHDRIPRLSNDRILLELERLIVLLGDGHSGIYGPDPDSPVRFDAGSLPVLFYEFDDGLYIIDAVGDARRWIGSRMLRFGPRSAEDVPRDLPRDIHHDNPMTVKWLGVRFRLPGLAFLHAVGATDDPTRAVLLRDVDRNYWLEPLPDHDAVFVGEPSASRPNFAGEETNLLLPWSRVRGSISTRYWQDSDPGDERQWIAPRIPVTLSADDYFANRDPVMATLLRVIERAAS